MSSYPPPPPPQFPKDWKAQRRAYRDQARTQRDLLRAQVRAGRRSSVVGPLLVILLGLVFLLIQTGRLQATRFWDWYGRWWPLLLIGLGVLLLLEWTADQVVARRAANRDGEGDGLIPTPARRTMGGGLVFLLVLLIGTGVVSSATGREGSRGFLSHHFDLDQDNLEEFMGDKHESDLVVIQAVPANASVSIDNPHGDVTVSGTSDDGQMHITAHRQVFSRSDEDAESKARQIAPKVDVAGANVMVSVPALEGARADLNILVPPMANLAITANHGDVRVQSMKSAVSLTANHGDVEVSAITGAVMAHTNSSSGSISAHSLAAGLTVEGRGHDLTMSEIGGPVSIHGDFFGTIHLERIRGGVGFHTSRTDLQLASLPGDLDINADADLSVNRAAGPVNLNTRNRNITLDGISGDLSVTNRNGSVDLTAAPPLGNVTVQNRHGSVTLTLPNKSDFALSAETTDGDVSNDFALTPQGTDSRKTLTGTVGKGGSTIRISTSQGDVAVKRASGSAPVRAIAPSAPAGEAVSIHGEDGSSVVIGKDGVRVTTGADGGSVVIGKDGLRIVARPDGSSVYKGKGGTELTENADGTKIYLGRDGTHFTESPDGGKIYTGKDGSSIVLRPDGTRTAVGSNGKSLSESEVRDRIRQAQEDVRRAEEQRDAERRQHEAGKNF